MPPFSSILICLMRARPLSFANLLISPTWEVAIEVGYIPFTPAPLTITLSSDLMDVDLQYVPIRRGRRSNRSFSRSPSPDRSFPEGHVFPLFRSRSYSR